MLAAASSPTPTPVSSDSLAQANLQGLAEGLLLFIFCLVLARFVPRLVGGAMRNAHVDPQVTLLVTRLVFLSLILLGILGFFSVWIKSPGIVFGSFGIFALAFSLAFQDILKNFIAGVFLLLERPFRIGDEITVEGHTGVVENVEIRTTTLRTEEAEEVLVPNSLVYTSTLVNRTRYPARQFTLTAKVPDAIPLDGLAERVGERLKTMDEVLRDPPPRVGLQPAVDGGVTIEVRYWLDYRRHDAITVRTEVGRQVFQAIHAGSPAATPAPSTRRP